MVSSLIEASAPLKKPVAADKAMAASKKLQGHVPRRILNQRARKRWGTVEAIPKENFKFVKWG